MPHVNRVTQNFKKLSTIFVKYTHTPTESRGQASYFLRQTPPNHMQNAARMRTRRREHKHQTSAETDSGSAVAAGCSFCGA